jgi:hypothetical protein
VSIAIRFVSKHLDAQCVLPELERHLLNVRLNGLVEDRLQIDGRYTFIMKDDRRAASRRKPDQEMRHNALRNRLGVTRPRGCVGLLQAGEL